MNLFIVTVYCYNIAHLTCISSNWLYTGSVKRHKRFYSRCIIDTLARIASKTDRGISNSFAQLQICLLIYLYLLNLENFISEKWQLTFVQVKLSNFFKVGIKQNNISIVICLIKFLAINARDPRHWEEVALFTFCLHNELRNLSNI